MAISTFAWVALAGWALGGLAGYYYLYRHGHPSPVWLLGGMILGPFSLPVFMQRSAKSSHTLVEHGALRSSSRRVVGRCRSAMTPLAPSRMLREMSPEQFAHTATHVNVLARVTPRLAPRWPRTPARWCSPTTSSW
jgi:hypothetical protein